MTNEASYGYGARLLRLLLLALCSGVARPVGAGPFGDDLSKCVVSRTTQEDRDAMARWFVASLSQHPAVSSIVAVSAEQRESANKGMADVMSKTIAERCKAEAEKTIRYEGVGAVAASMKLFGEAAGREVFTNPAVMSEINKLDMYLSPELKDLIKGSKP